MTDELMSQEEIDKFWYEYGGYSEDMFRLVKTARAAHTYRLTKEGAQMERDQLKEEVDRLRDAWPAMIAAAEHNKQLREENEKLRAQLETIKSDTKIDYERLDKET